MNENKDNNNSAATAPQDELEAQLKAWANAAPGRSVMTIAVYEDPEDGESLRAFAQHTGDARHLEVAARALMKATDEKNVPGAILRRASILYLNDLAETLGDEDTASAGNSERHE